MARWAVFLPGVPRLPPGASSRPVRHALEKPRTASQDAVFFVKLDPDLGRLLDDLFERNEVALVAARAGLGSLRPCIW